MNEINKYATITLDCPEDPRFNFTYMKKEHIDNFHLDPEIMYTDNLDYGLKICEGDKSYISPVMPISLAQIKTIEEGEEWFKDKYPKLPSEYWSIMAKYYFKEPFTKKSLKNDLKKLNKKGKCKNLQGLKIIRGKFKVEFD
tara:strand:+ start:189 stop:611 length:423 start_codon:yes stop_codon:yes gene_type:complete